MKIKGLIKRKGASFTDTTNECRRHSRSPVDRQQPEKVSIDQIMIHLLFKTTQCLWFDHFQIKNEKATLISSRFAISVGNVYRVDLVHHWGMRPLRFDAVQAITLPASARNSDNQKHHQIADLGWIQHAADSVREIHNMC